MIWTDRTRYETGQRCPRERFWGWHAPHEQGKVPGWTPSEQGLDLAFGSVVHEFVENWAMHRSQNRAWEAWKALQSDLVTPDGYPVKDELEALYKGFSKVFSEVTFPRLIEEFDWFDSEVEMTMSIGGGVNWMTRLDAVLRRRSSGEHFVLEIKTSSFPEELVDESRHNFQLLMEVESMRRHFKLRPEECGGAMLMIFNKGKKYRATKREQEQGFDGHRRLSPFTYWYVKQKANGETDYSLDYKSGFERQSVWNIPNWWSVGMKTWPEVFESQVQVWPSVSFDAERAEQVIQQVRWQETQREYWSGWIQEKDDALVDHLFPQNFRQCTNSGGFRRRCQFFDLCFSPNAARDPLEAGFVPRVANHPQEGQE